MSAAFVWSWFKARPEVPSAIQAVEATDQPEGIAAGLAALRSAFKALMADEVAKTVKASGPPQIEVASPEHGMLQRVVVLDKAAPFMSIGPQKHSLLYLHIPLAF